MCQHVQGFKKKKKRNLANFVEEWWKKNEESVEQNAIVRIDLKRITGKPYTHTHSSDCVGTFCINCVRHETEGESVRVCERKGEIKSEKKKRLNKRGSEVE